MECSLEQDVAGVSSTPEPDASQSFEAVEAETLERLAQRSGKTLPPKAASAPAKPVEQDASTDAKPEPASEPGKPKKNAESRIQELLAERDRERNEARLAKEERDSLRRELEEARRLKDVKPAESSTAKPSARDLDRYKTLPDAPKLDDYDDFQDWSIAVSDFVAEKRLEEYTARQRQEVEQGKYSESLRSVETKGMSMFPDFQQVMAEANAKAEAARMPRWPEHVQRKILTHEQGPAIAYALAKGIDDAALRARIEDPVDFGEYVAEFLSQQKTPRKFAAPAITKAPEPPMTLGERPADKGHDPTSVGGTDDFSEFDRGWLAKQRAKHA